MSEDATIDKLWEQSNHGTRREDVVAAFNAGAVAARETFEKVAACEKDAERYRWLRNAKDMRACTTSGIVTWFPTGTVIMKGGFFLDAAIDAALAKVGKGDV